MPATAPGRARCSVPPGGESTGEVHARLKAFFVDVTARNEDAIAVAHAGILRAAYVLATGWDMSGPYPPDLDLKAVMILDLAPDGTPAIAELNLPLRPRP